MNHESPDLDENISLIQHYLAQGKWDEAMALAEALGKQNQLELAVIAYQKIIVSQPEVSESHRKLGEIFQQQGKFLEATQAYQKSIELNPEFSWTYHSLGDTLYQLQKFEKATRNYYKAIELNPEFSWSYHNLGDTLTQLKQWDEATIAYQQAIKLNSNFSWSYYNLGDAYAQRQQWPGAISAYFQAAQLEPTLPALYDKLGLALEQGFLNNTELDQPDLKKVALQELLQVSSDTVSFYGQVAQFLVRVNYLEPAILVYQLLRELQPDNNIITQQLAEAQLQHQHLKNEVEQCRQAVAQNPNSSLLYYQLGAALTRQQKLEAAATAYLKAIELNPDFYWWFYYNLWEVLVKQDKLDDVIKLSRPPLEANPEIFWPYLNLGEALTRQGKLNEAIKTYQTISYQQTLKLYPAFQQNSETLRPATQPHFIIIGTQRGGTTSLYSALTQHPLIVPPLKKELDFWSWHFQRGIEWYLAHFPPLPQRQNWITGEASPSYFEHPEAPGRLHNTFPNVKLILLLRNPADRAISQYYHWRSLNWEYRSLETVITDEIERLAHSPHPLMGSEPGNYLARGLYIELIKPWLSLFPRQQLLILQSEDFYRDSASVVQQVLAFLDLPATESITYKNANPGAYPPADLACRHQLLEYFQPYNQQLENYLQRSFNWE